MVPSEDDEARLLVRVPAFLALVIVLVLTAPAPEAHACSCPPNDSTAQQVERADVVVRGTLTEVPDPVGTGSDPWAAYEVAVAEVFKDEPSATIIVRSPVGDATCGIGVREGPEYLVLAGRARSELRASLCDGTRLVSNELVAEVEAVTGPGTLVEAHTSTAPRGQTPTGTPLAAPEHPDGPGIALPLGVGAAGLLLILVALVAVRVRRRPRRAVIDPEHLRAP
ncbi:hypothetical protein [Knoellia sp. p5-6-4]|uniref:hypothetical protein n=1 Tax=unclassified Knoellia TaxID=2618719 RepID=UPI0023DA995E|nr:hypothetical protein [Knoellia sp. p5-6-4]MDF2143531.1 hypothetical protein [Knoellia sp. p5-6-4]